MDDTPIIEASELLVSLGISLGLGLLVGMQRETAGKKMAGIRTFPLVALFGALSAALALSFGGWVIATGLAGCVALTIVSNLAELRKSDDPGLGLTTEFALLLVFAIGAAVVMGYRLEATVCAGTVTVLLQGKSRMHGWVDRFSAGEVRELSRLVLLALVILPLLPNRDMGYLDVINPFKIWLMVVLIVAISLAAYLASKFIGGNKGVMLSGILGGLISSTATTAGVARRSKSAPDTSRSCAVIAVVATAVVFARVMAEVFVAGGSAGRTMLWPLGIMLAWSGVVALFLGRFASGDNAVTTEEEAPSEFKAAVAFALLYVAVLIGVAFAKERLGNAGLYIVAAVSGLTDMDAITLSTSRLVADGHIDTGRGWRVILLGGVSNMVFKAGMVALLAHRSMLWPILASFGATAAGAAALWVFWPG
ncbi:MAG: MgtC/SapB family protein [Akkermansiaceae bacterium]|nr:MgtC/SapB family protein [Akkermansiaceae bacterium]